MGDDTVSATPSLIADGLTVEDVTAYLQKKWTSDKCPYCGCEDWFFGEPHQMVCMLPVGATNVTGLGACEMTILPFSRNDSPSAPTVIENLGGGGDNGGMDTLMLRVGALEDDMKEVKADLKALIKGVALIEGKVSNLPTTFQMVTWFVGVAFALTGLVFAVAKAMASH